MATRTNGLEDTKSLLLDAAVEVFLEKGYDGTRVAEIARRVGMSTGAIYGNFENKSRLLSEALLQNGAGGMTMVADLLDDGPPGTPEATDRLVAILSAKPDTRHRLALELFAAAARDDDVARICNGDLDAADAFIESRLEDARRSGRVDDDISIEAYRYVLQLLVLGSFVAKAVGRPTPPADDIRTVVRRFMRGAERNARRRKPLSAKRRDTEAS